MLPRWSAASPPPYSRSMTALRWSSSFAEPPAAAAATLLVVVVQLAPASSAPPRRTMSAAPAVVRTATDHVSTLVTTAVQRTRGTYLNARTCPAGRLY